jgi:hypothetical protein
MLMASVKCEDELSETRRELVAARQQADLFEQILRRHEEITREAIVERNNTRRELAEARRQIGEAWEGVHQLHGSLAAKLYNTLLELAAERERAEKAETLARDHHLHTCETCIASEPERNQAKADHATACAENERLRKALEFYTNASIWWAPDADNSLAWLDGGKTARRALEGK